VLKAAAESGASRPDLKSAEVLAIADRQMVSVETPPASSQPAERTVFAGRADRIRLLWHRLCCATAAEPAAR
jgi:hypothetical protein